MSTSRDLDLVQTLSRWLAGHVDAGQVQQALEDPGDLGPESQQLIDELRDELARGDVSRPKLQPLVRETIEAVALDE
jgi:hypothetical protein